MLFLLTTRGSARRPWALALSMLWLGLLAASGMGLAQEIPTARPIQSEASSGISAQSGGSIKTHRFAVAAANPLATQAGYQILKAGGSAVDAAIAVQMVLALVEPQSSGLGGGAFLVHFDGQHTQVFDGRETAPAAADPQLFMTSGGQPMAFMDAVVGGRAVGTPGVVSMLALAHRQHGRLAWERLFAPAIALAENGFAVSPRLATLLATETALQKDPVAAAYFYDSQGKPWTVGHVLRNPELAAVLRRVAKEGPDGLMTGDVAQAIVNKVHTHPVNPGSLSLQDLKSYQPLERAPLCFDYAVAKTNHRYRICGAPPPSSGTLAVGQILGLLSNTAANDEQPTNGNLSVQWLHLYTESARLAFADRGLFVADPAFVSAPAGNWNSLLNPDYLRARAQLIDAAPGGKSMPTALPGNPDHSSATTVGYAPMTAQPEYGTSQISIVDAQGHALAMTTTIEDAFGSRQMVNRGLGLAGGFLLNNQLTDFSFSPSGANGQAIANRVEPLKRPRSSMSPMLVFDKDSGALVMCTGSPLGAMIIHFVAKTLYGVLNWGLDPQQAIDLPNFGTINGPVILEAGRFDASAISALKRRGHTMIETDLPSGLQAIVKTPDGFVSGTDPRREGTVMGD